MKTIDRLVFTWVLQIIAGIYMANHTEITSGWRFMITVLIGFVLMIWVTHASKGGE